MLPGDLTPLVDWFLEMKSNVIQIKDMHFSSLINKAQGTSILPNSQSGHIISIATSKRPIEESNLFVDHEINSDCIGQHIIPYQEANDNSLSKLNLSQMFTLDSISMWVALLVLNSVHNWSQKEIQIL